MKLESRRYSLSEREQWDSFVNNESINGTFLHTRGFFEANPANESQDHSLIFYKKSKPVAVFPANIYTTATSKILHSHPRATYGGFVVGPEIKTAEAIELVDHVLEYAKKEDVKEIIVRNPFRVFYKEIADEVDYALWYRGFSIRSRELETAIALGNYDTIRGNYDDSTKRSVRKSQTNISVRITDDLERYWEILTKNLSLKHGAKPTHNYEEIQALIEKVGKERIVLFGAYKEDQLVGGIVAFIANSLTIHAQYIASDEAFQEFRPVNAVIDEMIRWGCEQQFKYLNLGTSNTAAGREVNEGLFRFKEGFNGRSVLRETLHLTL